MTDAQTTDAVQIHGFCEPRFHKARDLFAENWSLFQEVGASIAATVDGKPVLDLWGGWMDAGKTRPWERDTLVLVASVSKGITGLIGNMLIERGLLDPEAPVARYWPQFAANGKEGVLVKHLFNHTAGLPNVAAGIETTDWSAVVQALAAAKPLWPAGTAHSYHAMTFGHLIGELVRRTTGLTVGQFLRQEIAEPLGADAWIGLPEPYDDRVADLIGAHYPEWSTLAWRREEVPAANCHTNGRALARIFGVLACGGELDGVHLLNRSTIDEATASFVTGRWFGWTDEMMATFKVPDSVFKVRFGRGFAMSNDFAWMGPNPKTFGSGGSGGALAFADPDARVSFGYAQNAHLGQGHELDSRTGRVIQAIYEAL